MLAAQRDFISKPDIEASMDFCDLGGFSLPQNFGGAPLHAAPPSAHEKNMTSSPHPASSLHQPPDLPLSRSVYLRTMAKWLKGLEGPACGVEGAISVDQAGGVKPHPILAIIQLVWEPATHSSMLAEEDSMQQHARGHAS